MKKKKNLTVKIMAILALSAIIISVVGTGILFVYEIYFNSSSQTDMLTPEEVEAYLEQLNLQQEVIEDDDIISEEIEDESQYQEELVDEDTSEEEIN